MEIKYVNGVDRVPWIEFVEDNPAATFYHRVEWQGIMERCFGDKTYYLMAVDNPSLVRSEEVCNAFLKAKAAGKVGYFGLSTHGNAQKVLEAAIETGWYDLAIA